MKTVVRWFSVLVLLLTALPLPGLAAQQRAPSSTIVVNTLVDDYLADGYCSLREAIDAANSNWPWDACPGGDSSIADTITFAITGTIVLGAPLPDIWYSGPTGLAGPLVIDGGEDKDIAISGGGNHRIFEVAPNAHLTLKNLTVFNGSAGVDGLGGGLYNDGGTVEVEGCTFSFNKVTVSGGGLYNKDGEVTIRDSLFGFNEATLCGGGIFSSGNLEIYDSEFTLNKAFNCGGGVAGDNMLLLKIWETEFNFNEAPLGGGLVVYNGGQAWVYSSTFYYNEAVQFGGGVNIGWGSTGTISDTLFTHNEAKSGGGLVSELATVTIDSCEFMTNTAKWGGALSLQGADWVPYLSSNYSIRDSVIRKNTAVEGGGLNAGCADGLIVGSEFSENTAEKGGAIYSAYYHIGFGYMKVFNSTFSENTGGLGAGIYNITNTLWITNSTLSNNSATFNANNLCNDSPGLLKVQNSIVANGGSGTNCVGAITDGGHNLDTGTSCGFSLANGSLNSTDPLLGPLDQNASPKLSRTHALLLGSPAINQADPSLCPVDDQRGFLRRDGYCDIGAYEAQLASLTALSGSGQSTLVLSNFPNPLRVELEDPYGNHLGGVPVTFTGPSSGAGISNSGSVMTSDQTGIVAFTATANGTAGGPYQVNATSGGFQAGFSLTNLPCDSTTQITSDIPDPSFAGGTFTVYFTVTSGQGTPPGSVTVTVSGRSEKCTGQLSAGQGSCSLSIPTPGEYTLVATYSGSVPYPASSDTEAHTVRAASIGDFQLFLPLVSHTLLPPFR
jgi:CSLREA domain-containing protein